MRSRPPSAVHPACVTGTIAECYLLSGRYDYVMRASVRDMADYETFHKEQISRLPGVARVETQLRQCARFWTDRRNPSVDDNRMAGDGWSMPLHPASASGP